MTATKKELFAITTALLLAALLFTADSTFAESKSTIRSKIRVNGETIIDEEATSNGTSNSDIEVKIENGEGTVKYNVNGQEKTIQVTPGNNKSTNTPDDTAENDDNDVSGVRKEDDVEDELDKTEDEKEDTENKDNIKEKFDETVRKDEKAGDLIEAMMIALDSFFESLSSLLQKG